MVLSEGPGGGTSSVWPPRAVCPLAPCPQLPGPTPESLWSSPHLLPHDSRFSLEPKVGLLFIPKLSFILGFDVLDLSVLIFLNLLLGFLEFPKLLPDIFLCLPWGRERKCVLKEGAVRLRC